MRNHRRGGNTIIEVIAASVIIAMTLVPSLRMMRDSLSVSRDVENADMMSTLCASRLEQTLSNVCGVWNTTTESGGYSAQGYAHLKYQVTKSDLVADGGIPSRLMAITAVVWDDTDSDNNLDSNEKRVRYSSKIARSVSYNYEATGN